MQINNIFNFQGTGDLGPAQAGSVLGQPHDAFDGSIQNAPFAACLEESVSANAPVRTDTPVHEEAPSSDEVSASEEDSAVASEEKESTVSDGTTEVQNSLIWAMVAELTVAQTPVPVVDVVAMNADPAEETSLDGLTVAGAKQVSESMPVAGVSVSGASPRANELGMSEGMLSAETISSGAVASEDIVSAAAVPEESVMQEAQRNERHDTLPQKPVTEQVPQELSAPEHSIPVVKSLVEKPVAQDSSVNAVADHAAESASIQEVNGSRETEQGQQAQTRHEQQGNLFSEEPSKRLLNTETKSILSSEVSSQPAAAQPVVTEISISGAHALESGAGVSGDNAQATHLEQLARQELVGQMVDKMRTFVKNGVQEAQIELRPEFLGKVMVKMSMDGDRLSVRMEVSNPMVRELLESNFSQLKDSLMDRGFSMDSFNIMLDQHSSGQPAPQDQGMASQYVPEGNYSDSRFLEEPEASYEMAGIPGSATEQAYSINYMA